MIQDHDPDHAERTLRKIHDRHEKIEWGRVPQEHRINLAGSPTQCYCYRELVGNAGYRVVHEISGDAVVVAVLPKDDATYDLVEFVRRTDGR